MRLHPTQWLPTIFIVEYIACAIVYASYHDWRRVAYWLAAAVLNASITF